MMFIAGLFILSGLSALLYEVCWMRAFVLLFGSSSYATAVTLSAFFLGLALGNACWGRLAQRFAQPLRLYGGLELAVALSALLYFVLPDVHRWVFSELLATLPSNFSWLLSAKFVLALIALLPMTFFMGGTLPVLSRLTAQNHLSVLYGANTLGAALGALAAGFVLPAWLGYAATYLLALLLSTLVGVLAFMRPGYGAVLPVSTTTRPAALRLDRTIQALALWSGMATLGLQVLWTRLFAQVLQNSVYTFAAILTVFLLCLAASALLVHHLPRWRRSTAADLALLLTVAGLAVAATPSLFLQATDGLQYIGSGLDWLDYMAAVLWLLLKVLGLPLLCLGAVFPCLLDTLRHDDGLAMAVGRLTALNTIGAIFGSLLAGFLLLTYAGLWVSIQSIAAVYLLAALALAWVYREPGSIWQPLVVLVLLFSLFDVTSTPVLHLESDEQLLWQQETSAASVAVVQKDTDQLRIKVNNHYTLGGTGSRVQEALQGYLPVRLHPHPEQVFFLGLGTGISAGGALPAGAGRISVAELLPGVIEAAQRFFGAYQHGLFQAANVTILPDDGRSQLAISPQRYDVIVADLFVPWEAGAGNLYTLEHFQAVHAHLREDGWLMQWLPAYQLSPDDFAVIVHTVQQVFPDVSLWRDDFSAQRPVLGLLARRQSLPLTSHLTEKPRLFGSTDNVPLAMRLVAEDAALRALYQNQPSNRDNRPLTEWQTPISQRQHKTGLSNWLTGNALLALLDKLHDSRAATAQMLPAKLQYLSEAGYRLHRAQLLTADGYLSAADSEMARVKQLQAHSQTRQFTLP